MMLEGGKGEQGRRGKETGRGEGGINLSILGGPSEGRERRVNMGGPGTFHTY